MVSSLLAHILRDFCHVEWYEVEELKAAVNSGSVKFDVELFRLELADCIMNYPAIPTDEINRLTGNEFQTQEEVRQWLDGIWRSVFGS